MNAKTVLITGGNRGLGLQFVNSFVGLETPPQKLIVTCRDVENATVSSRDLVRHNVAWNVWGPSDYVTKLFSRSVT